MEEMKPDWRVLGRPSSSDLREEECDHKARGSSTLFSDAAMEAMLIVPDEMKYICMVHDLAFWALLRAYEDVTGDSLEGKVDLLSSPPYNVTNKRSMDNSWHEIFPPETMSKFVGLARQVILAVAEEHSLCSWIQFPK